MPACSVLTWDVPAPRAARCAKFFLEFSLIFPTVVLLMMGYCICAANGLSTHVVLSHPAPHEPRPFRQYRLENADSPIPAPEHLCTRYKGYANFVHCAEAETD